MGSLRDLKDSRDAVGANISRTNGVKEEEEKDRRHAMAQR